MTSTIKRDPIVKLVLFQSHFHLYKRIIVERKLMWIIKQTFKSSFQAFSLCLGGFLQLLSPLRKHHLTVQKNGRRARERESRKWQPSKNRNHFWSPGRIALYLVSIERGISGESYGTKAAGCHCVLPIEKFVCSSCMSEKGLQNPQFWSNHSGLHISYRANHPLSIVVGVDAVHSCDQKWSGISGPHRWRLEHEVTVLWGHVIIEPDRSFSTSSRGKFRD